MQKDEMKELLIRICKKDNNDRRNALISELQKLNVQIENNNDSNIICRCNENDIVVLSAHYDVVPNSFGYNDNGVSLLILLNIINRLPNNVQVIFTDMEEFGGIGADKFIKTTNKNIKGCINLDVCGIGDYIYCDNYNNDLFPKDCKFGKMPFCDGDVFKEYNIPVLTFSTSYKDMDFREGISEIFKTIHNNERDNYIDIINFDLVENVSDKMLESISLF
jgi:hypothetical protein